ncbi:MAG: hypothetical protein NTW94_02275 [Legionellales bacterium]|nr:hypothetical protein [Legionellales bacterium]
MVVNNGVDRILTLWTPYYADFLQKSITATIKNKDPIQQSLCYGNDHFSALLAALERTDQAITSIRTQITEAPKTKIETIKIKRELLADLLVVTEYMKKEDQVEYSILKAEFNAVIGSQRIRPKREAEQVRARPTEEKQIVPRTFKVAEMSVAMKVKDILEGTTLLGDALTIPKKRTSCEAFQGEIHESVLLPWEEAASRRDLLSVVFFGYQPQDVRNLRRYQSRLNQVLDIIHKELSPLRAARHPSFVVQNDFINEFLLKTLFDMTVDMPWHDAAVKLHKKRSNELAKESLSKFEFSGDMLTVTCPRTLTIDAQECHRRAEARSEEMRVELTEERVRAKKAEQEVEKAKQEAEKAKQEAKIARMEAAGAKKRTGEAEKNEKIARAETTAIRDSLNKIVKLTVENSGPAPQPAPTAAPKTAPAPEARPAAPAAAARPETAKASAGETIASSLKSKAENASTKLHRFSSSMKEGGGNHASTLLKRERNNIYSRRGW